MIAGARSLGIDVGLSRGLDAVLLDGSPRPGGRWRRLRTVDVEALLRDARPDVVAIDSPPGWAAAGRSRRAERELARAGIHAFATPTGERGAGNAFYDWMRAGFEVFGAAAAAGYRRYREGPVHGTAVEVFPHATAVTLARGLPPPGVGKSEWRRDLLARRGIEVAALTTLDQIDATLAALTGLMALAGTSCGVGDPEEGVIVVPVTELPAGRYVRPLANRPEAVGCRERGAA